MRTTTLSNMAVLGILFIQLIPNWTAHSLITYTNHCFFLSTEFGSSKLVEFLMFTTGLRALPPLGLDEKITICYREDDSPYFFAETCTMELKVPIVHDQYSKFHNSFLEACMHSVAGFSCY